MGILTLDHAYTISLSILIISTVVSRLELLIISSLYVDFAFSGRHTKYKELEWKLLNYVIMVCSFFSGISFMCKASMFFKFFFYIAAIGVIYLYSVKKTTKDSSDQIRVLAYFSFILCMVLDNETGKIITIGSLGVQSLISYTTSGLSKAFSKNWKSENILTNILSTYSYGISRTTIFLKKSPSFEKFLSRLTVATLLAIPVCFFIPYQYPLIVTLLGILIFHFFTAILLGLNDFLFTFSLTYPGILILHAFIFKY